MKKAQVTLFIILGVVIAISVTLFLMLKTNVTKEVFKGDTFSPIVEELPSQFLPVQPFVEKCLESTARTGIILLGQRGGYIYPDKLKPSQKSTDGDSVKFSTTSGPVVPYWFYMAAENDCSGDCRYDSNKIQLRKTKQTDSIEDQLAKYIDENLKYCINDFKSIKTLGFEVAENDVPKSTVIVSERNLLVRLTYPITVSKQKNRIDFDKFYATLDVDIANIYRMAEYITQLEQEYHFLERDVLNIIVAFSGKDKRKLPPMSDSDFELKAPVRWSKSQVRNNVRNILSSYIPMLRMVDTLNWKEIDTGVLYKDELYNYGMSVPNNISITNLGVSFDYLDFWDIYFDLNCRDDVCEPEAAFTDLIPVPVGMQRYNFAYDVSFPVLVTLEDPNAFGNQGYAFSFMLEANVRNNRAMEAEFVQDTITDLSATMLCDENKRTSGDIVISVTNSVNNSNVDGVQVMYSCIDSCYIGETQSGVLNTSLPMCMGGVLSFRREGYETKYVSYDSAVGKTDTVGVTLDPLKEVSIAVEKLQLVKDDDTYTLKGQSGLLDYETAVVTLRKNSPVGEPQYNIVEVKSSSSETTTISPGLYQIEVNLVAEKQYKIPPEKKNFAGNEVTIEGLDVSSFVTGMTSMNYTFTKEDLQKDRLTVKVLWVDVYATPENERKLEDIELMQKFNDYTIMYHTQLLPRLE